MKFSTQNEAIAYLLIQELVQLGVKNFCTSAGARCAPLIRAINLTKDIKKYSFFDERSLSFFALGIAKEKKAPVCIITTSGSALANCYPAIVEAKLTNTNLIIISADRPKELVGIGENQTINQTNFYGEFAPFFLHINASFSQNSNILLTKINNTFYQAKENQVPLQINISFTEPLFKPENKISLSDFYKTKSQKKYYYLEKSQNSFNLKAFLKKIYNRQTLLVFGELEEQVKKEDLVYFLKTLNLPNFTSVQFYNLLANSTLNLDPTLLKEHFNLLNNFEYIVVFGARLIDKKLLALLASFQGEIIYVNKNPDIKLATCNFIEHFCVDLNLILFEFKKLLLNKNKKSNLVKKTIKINRLKNKKLTEKLKKAKLNEIKISSILNNFFQESLIFLGNSLAIRAFGFVKNFKAKIISNRGASGIDGLLATAAGAVICANYNRNFLLIGDMSFAYDLNSLFLLEKIKKNFIVLVINNNGANIFDSLYLKSKNKKEKQDFYQMQPNYNLEKVCQGFNYLEYKKITTAKSLKKELKNSTLPKPYIFEIFIKKDSYLNFIKTLY